MILLFVKSSPAVIRNLTGHPLNVLVLLYFGCIILTVPFALWPGGAAQIVQFFFPAVLLYSAFNFVPPTREMFDRVILGFVVIVLALASYLILTKAPGSRRLYIPGTFDSNDTASIFAMTLPFAIGMLFRANNAKRRIATGLAVLMLVVGVIETGSRGGTLALATGALVYLLGTRGNKALVLTVVMVIGGSVAWITAPPFFRDRINSLVHLERDYNLTAEAGRKAIWSRARMYIRQHPLLGVGAGNFMVAEGNYNADVGRTGKWSAAHNAYLQALAELGFLGGGVYILMLLTAAVVALRVWRDRSRPRGPPAVHYPELLAGLLAFAVGATFLSHAYFQPMFGVLGMIMLADRVRVTPATVVLSDASPVPQQRPGERGGFTIAASRQPAGQRGALAFQAMPFRNRR